MDNIGTHDERRRELLSVAWYAREAQKLWENRYVKAHLREVELYVEQALVQMEYVRLAEERDRGSE